MADLILETEADHSGAGSGFGVRAADLASLRAYSGVIRLLDGSDQDRAILAPGAERELLYRVLQTPLGDSLRQVALSGEVAHRIRPALVWVRENYREHLRIEALAEACHLSQSSLFRYFRQAAGSTPMHYQKRLRLQEGRRLLLEGGMTASQVLLELGHLNPAQFHREYVRLVGTTPGQDARAMSRPPSTV